MSALVESGRIVPMLIVRSASEIFPSIVSPPFGDRARGTGIETVFRCTAVTRPVLFCAPIASACAGLRAYFLMCKSNKNVKQLPKRTTAAE